MAPSCVKSKLLAPDERFADWHAAVRFVNPFDATFHERVLFLGISKAIRDRVGTSGMDIAREIEGGFNKSFGIHSFEGIPEVLGLVGR